MRKYRGLTKEGKWVYGWYFGIWEQAYILWGTTNDVPNMVEVIPETVGQQTSLKDKNGEGDEVYGNNIVSSFNGIKYHVYWDSEYGQWWGHIINKTKGKYTKPLCEILNNSYMHIIGNIHTKPELLEKQGE